MASPQLEESYICISLYNVAKRLLHSRYIWQLFHDFLWKKIMMPKFPHPNHRSNVTYPSIPSTLKSSHDFERNPRNVQGGGDVLDEQRLQESHGSLRGLSQRQGDANGRCMIVPVAITSMGRRQIFYLNLPLVTSKNTTKCRYTGIPVFFC